MTTPPSNAVFFETADTTVMVAPSDALGIHAVRSLGALNGPVVRLGDDRVRWAFDTLGRDPGQVIRLKGALASWGLPSSPSSTDSTFQWRPTGSPFDVLLPHLRSGRLTAIPLDTMQVRFNASQSSRGQPGPGVGHRAPAASLPGGVAHQQGTNRPSSAAAAIVKPSAGIAGWSTEKRIEVLLRDTLPLLGKDLRAELEVLLTGVSLAYLVGGMLLMAGIQAIPIVGEVADAVFLAMAYRAAGLAGLTAIVGLTKAVHRTLVATSSQDIADAAPLAATSMITLGDAFITVLMIRMQKRNTSGGEAAGGAAEAEAQPVAAANRGTGSAGRSGSKAVATDAAGEAGTAPAGAVAEAGGRTSENTATATATGHPVNVATGEVFTEQTDFVLPGPLPLVFGRIWISSSTIAGELGHGWHHTLDMALLPGPGNRVSLRLADGRYVPFDRPAPGQPTHDAVERIQLCRQEPDPAALGADAIAAVDQSGRRYEFGPETGLQHLRRLATISDSNGNAITLTRNALGGLTGIRDSAGRDLAVRRDTLGHIVGIDAPHPDGDGTLTLVAFDYDRHGDLVASRDATGGEFRYGYERHLLVEERRPAGLTFRFQYDDTARRTTARCLSTWGDNGLYDRTLAYDDAARRTTVRSRRGAVEIYQWNAQRRVVVATDALGRRRLNRYAPDGKLALAETRADGATRSRTHDRFGRVTETVDFDGAVTRVQYGEPDADGLVTALPLRIETPGGAAQQFAWDARLNLASHTDAAGRTRRFLRDTRGLTLAVQDALGTLRRFSWTDRGELAWEAAGTGGPRSQFTYDALGRLTERRVSGLAPTRYVSDPAGRLVEIRRTDGGIIRLAHDAEGHVTRHQDATGAVTQWRYDGLPFPVARTDADGSTLGYRYDADLNLTGLTNQKGEQYVLRYDLGDQLVEEVGFDGRRRTYDYDTAGFLAAHGDEEARGATYRRDGLGRLLERRHSDGLTDRYGYDTAGALTLAANDWGEIGFAYGPDGSLVEERSPAGAIVHGYDARGRRMATTLPDGRVIETGWDAQDNVASVGFDGRTVATFGRDALGRETERRAGALTTLSDYDPQGRLSRQTGRIGSGTGAVAGQPVIERSYRWDTADRLVETLDLASGVRRYQYDARARLVGVEGDLPEQFVIDPAGNILGASSDEGAGTPGVAKGDRLLMRGDRKFEYDGCGNRVREIRGAGGNVERLYRYRADNQLAEVEERSRRGRRVTSFTYDALGRRTEKRSTVWGPVAANDAIHTAATSDLLTSFVWAGKLLLAEGSVADSGSASLLLPSDLLATIFLHEPQTFRPLAQVRRNAFGDPGRLYHYQLDHLGTPHELSNDDGNVVWQIRQKAWGGVALVLVEDFIQPISFQGQYRDSETGLLYNRFRYYSSDESCYINQDPLRLVGGTNISAYVPNPTEWIDPYGLCPVEGKADFYVNSHGETLPSTGYRYMRYLEDDGTVNRYVANTIQSKTSPGSYFGFSDFSSGSAARSAFQIKGPELGQSWSDARLKGTFDTLQLFDNNTGQIDAFVPRELGGNGPDLEPITKAYPEYGSGGAHQLRADSIISFDKVETLPEE